MPTEWRGRVVALFIDPFAGGSVLRINMIDLFGRMLPASTCGEQTDAPFERVESTIQPGGSSGIEDLSTVRTAGQPDISGNPKGRIQTLRFAGSQDGRLQTS